MPQVVRKRSGILPLISELIFGGMSQHMRMDRERKLSCLTGTLHHP
jgi:hypothetical protein